MPRRETPKQPLSCELALELAAVLTFTPFFQRVRDAFMEILFRSCELHTINVLEHQAAYVRSKSSDVLLDVGHNVKEAHQKRRRIRHVELPSGHKFDGVALRDVGICHDVVDHRDCARNRVELPEGRK